MFDKLVPNTQRRLDNITLESNRYAATPERSPVNVALTGETTARHTNSLHHIKEFRGEHAARAIARLGLGFRIGQDLGLDLGLHIVHEVHVRRQPMRFSWHFPGKYTGYIRDTLLLLHTHQDVYQNTLVGCKRDSLRLFKVLSSQASNTLFNFCGCSSIVHPVSVLIRHFVVISLDDAALNGYPWYTYLCSREQIGLCSPYWQGC